MYRSIDADRSWSNASGPLPWRLMRQKPIWPDILTSTHRVLPQYQTPCSRETRSSEVLLTTYLLVCVHSYFHSHTSAYYMRWIRNGFGGPNDDFNTTAQGRRPRQPTTSQWNQVQFSICDESRMTCILLCSLRAEFLGCRR